MSPSTFMRAAAAATLLASTASANIAMYWGQGDNQLTLTEICNDPTIDIVNIAFVNGFPKKRGDYPKTNFANACWKGEYVHPTDPENNKGFMSECPSIEPGINTCRANGKKVLLSLGGGAPTDYYLPSEDVADYFAEFLVKTFGPKPSSDYTGPRPFGSAYVDGFDLDLEAEEANVPSKEYISANYAFFVNRIKHYSPKLLISSAPQCTVPDPRLADAISKAPFDFIFTQFYNTDYCSAKLGYQQRNQATTGFTFKEWAQWLEKNSKNKGVKLYLGLAAGEDGLPTHKDHYLKPDEASALITKWKAQYPSIFGGVMLWEASVSARNVVNCQSYSYWMKATLDGTFSSKFSKGCSISSSIKPSSTKASSTIASTTSAAVTATATVISPDGSCGIKNGIAYTCKGLSTGDCCSQYGWCGGEASAPQPREVYCGTGCNPLFGNCGDKKSSSIASSTAKPSSSSKAVSSSATSKAVSSSTSKAASASASSSVHPSSSAPASSSVHHSSSAPASSSVHPSSSAPASSSVHPSSSSPASSSVYPSSSGASSSDVHSASTPVVTPSASHSAASSSAHDSASIPYPSGNGTHVPYPTGAASSSATKQVYPHSSSDLVYPSNSASVPHYGVNATTSCTTSTKAPTPTPDYPVYDSPASSSAKKNDEYPPSVTSKPGQDYPVYPASSTTKVITTTYVDSCETGITTKTETITKTICNKCKDEDSVTSVYVCHKCGPSVVTITITKPNYPATDVPSYPTPPAKPEGPSYGGDKPQPPAKPSTPSQGGDKPAPPTYGNDKPEGPAKPVHTPTYDVPKKQENPITSTTVSIVYVVKTPLPSVKHTPVPYPSGPTPEYPTKPSGTGVPPTKPTGTGAPTKPTYAPPQFTGAASRVGAGMTGLLAIVAGFMVL